MMDNLPNTITTHDKGLIESIVKTEFLCRRLYDAQGYLVNLDAFNEKTGELECHTEYVDIFGTVDNMIARNEFQIPISFVKIENYLPTDKDSGYLEFKQTSVIVPWLKDGKVNVECPVVYSLQKQGVEVVTPELTSVIYHPQSKIPVIYTEGEDHPFTFYFGCHVFRSDSLDLLYKLGYDHSNFKTSELLAFEQYLESKKGQDTLDRMINEVTKEHNAVSSFASSDRFNELTKSLGDKLSASDSGVFVDNCEDYGFKSPDEYYLFFDAMFSLNEEEEDMGALFRTFSVKHESLVLIKTHGQGTLHMIKKVTESE